MPGIEWSLVTRVVGGIALLFAGAWIKRWFESRPALFSYFGRTRRRAGSRSTSIRTQWSSATRVAVRRRMCG